MPPRSEVARIEFADDPANLPVMPTRAIPGVYSHVTRSVCANAFARGRDVPADHCGSLSALGSRTPRFPSAGPAWRREVIGLARMACFAGRRVEMPACARDFDHPACAELTLAATLGHPNAANALDRARH